MDNHFVYLLGILLFLLHSTSAYRYVVSTYTGDRFGAGTDARVFISLFGSKGEIEDKELESSGRDNFERGQIDTFVLDAKNNLGRVKRAKIRHDNSWLGPGWFLEKVTVTSEDGDYYEFPCNKWLDKRIDDGRTSRELIPRPQKKHKIEPVARQPLECSWPLGISNYKISDSQISASTSFNDLHLPFHGRLGMVVSGSLGGWCPYTDSGKEYLEIDLLGLKKVTGVATEGMGLVDEWTTAYHISYSNDTSSEYHDMKDSGNDVKDFVGNDDQNGTVQHWFLQPFLARFIRVTPIEWHGKGCLRLELYGCDADVPQIAESSDKSGTLQVTSTQPHGLKSTPSNEPLKKTSKDVPGSARALSTALEQKMEDSPTLDIVPIIHLDFDEIREAVIPDVSGHHNDAHLRRPAEIVTFSRACQRGLKLNGGDVYFDGEFLVDKPKEEITMAAWIKLFSNGGQHSIFDTVGGKTSQHRDGQYHFEVDRGHLRWFHRNEEGTTIFNISTGLMVPAHIWTHCAATYDTVTGRVAVFVNGKLGAQGYGIGELSQDWSGRAGIGKHKNQRILNGEVDEFYVFNRALSPTKIELLMKRCSFETDCQQALGMQSKTIEDAQITASSTYNLHKPFYGRINLASFWGDPARTAWCANKEDKNPYLEVDLGEVKSLTGVATQGLSIFDNWVTSYLLCYSNNKAAWNCYKERGYDKVFEGNTDKNTVKRHYLHHTVNGRYVRIRPQSWYGNHLCMRAEIYGCTMDLEPDPFDSFGNIPNLIEESEAQTRGEISQKASCNFPLGMSNGEVDDNHISASSSLSDANNPYYARLVRDSMDAADIRGCWCARDISLRQHIEADLGETKTIVGVATQGYVSHDNWVASYRLGYKDENGPQRWYQENHDEKLFIANTDRANIVKHYLKEPIKARYIRINPRAWHGIHICMRFEVFGCQEGSSHKHHETASTAPKLKAKDKVHAHKTEHHKTKSEHEHAKQTLKLLTDRQHKLNTPLNLRLKQQVQQHTGKQKHILPVVPKKVLNKPLKSAHHPPPRPLMKSPSPKAFAKAGLARRPMHKIRIVYVPTNQSAVSLVQQGAVKPLYKKPVGETPFIGNRPRQTAAVKPQISTGKNLQQSSLQQPYYPKANQKVNIQQPMGGPLLTKPVGKNTPKPIDADRIFNEFPQLRASGVTEEILRDLNNRVPNLEQRIEAHFKARHVKPALYANSVHHDLAASNLAFMKNFHEALESQKSKQITNEFGNNKAIEKSPVNTDLNTAINMPSTRKASGRQDLQETAVTNRLQTLALQNFQNSFMGKTKPQTTEYNLQTADQMLGYKTPSDLSLQRFRQENVPESAYRSGNFDKQTNHPGLLFLPGDQLTSYSYNGSTSRGILPQPIRYPWQQNRLASFYSNSQFKNSWTSFTSCSSTCGRGMKKRYRKCEIPDCPTGGVEIETVPCLPRPCADAADYSWSAYSPCSISCGSGISTRSRLCSTANCGPEGKEVETVPCYKPACPICLLDFEVVEGKVVVDQSGKGNNAYLDKSAVVRPHDQMCGHYADLTGEGDIILVDKTFRGKPQTGITIACWVNLQGSLTAKHSLFSTVRMVSPVNFIGGYHFELDNGKVRWFHRDEGEKTIFSLITTPIVEPKVWMHIAATYDAYKAVAKVYVDGKEQGTVRGDGLLSQDWGYKAAIGHYDFDDRRLEGMIDEFRIYDYALNENQIFGLIGKLRCSANKTTTEIDAFKFQGINLKRSLKEDRTNFEIKVKTYRIDRGKVSYTW